LPVLAVIAAVGVALGAPGTASARVTPLGQQFDVIVVDHISDAAFATFARRGAVGLLRPGAGESTNRRLALAELVRGHPPKPGHPGVPHIAADTEPVANIASCRMCVVLELPTARGRWVANDKLYRIAVVGEGYRGILTSPRTRIPGLVSVLDVVPTVLPGHQTTALSSTPTRHAVQTLASLNQQIGANDRLKLPALFILAGLLLLLALFGGRVAVTAVPAALLTNLFLGATQVSNEVVLVAAISAGTVLLAFLLARVCRSDDALLLLFGGVAALYAVAMVVRPEWQAINPFGPTQNQRFWGIGNQVETLLLVPFLAGAMIAQRRFGFVGFALFGAFGLVVLTDNRLGADGGGAVTLGVALAVLGWRLFRLRLGGLVSLLASMACLVLWVVSRGLAQPGQNHFRGAFSGNGIGFLRVLESLVPLSYVPAVQRWPIVVPLLLICAAIFVVAWRRTSNRATRDLLLALGLALITSLLVNDSAAYVLAGGIAVIAAAARFVPTSAPARIRVRVPVLRRTHLAAEPVASDSPPAR
jgi:hypothetical protein